MGVFRFRAEQFKDGFHAVSRSMPARANTRTRDILVQRSESRFRDPESLIGNERFFRPGIILITGPNGARTRLII